MSAVEHPGETRDLEMLLSHPRMAQGMFCPLPTSIVFFITSALLELLHSHSIAVHPHQAYITNFPNPAYISGQTGTQ